MSRGRLYSAEGASNLLQSVTKTKKETWRNDLKNEETQITFQKRSNDTPYGVIFTRHKGLGWTTELTPEGVEETLENLGIEKPKVSREKRSPVWDHLGRWMEQTDAAGIEGGVQSGDEGYPCWESLNRLVKVSFKRENFLKINGRKEPLPPFSEVKERLLKMQKTVRAPISTEILKALQIEKVLFAQAAVDLLVHQSGRGLLVTKVGPEYSLQRVNPTIRGRNRGLKDQIGPRVQTKNLEEILSYQKWIGTPFFFPEDWEEILSGKRRIPEEAFENGRLQRTLRADLGTNLELIEEIDTFAQKQRSLEI